MCLSANKHTVLSLAVKAEVLQMENHRRAAGICVCLCVCARVCVYSARMRRRKTETDGATKA